MTPTSRRTVALIGNPNTGKSSLFNALCGTKARVGNYPGVTVEQKVGRMVQVPAPTASPTSPAPEIDVIDLPGTYSLAARSADEAVSVDVLSGNMPGTSQPEAVVVILDATNLERNLYLFSQVLELGLPTIAVLNMWDRTEPSGIQLRVEELSQRLGVPIVCTCAAKRTGIDSLRQSIVDALAGSPRSDSAKHPADTLTSTGRACDTFPEAFRSEVTRLREWLSSQRLPLDRFQVERLLIDTGDAHAQRLIPAQIQEPWNAELTRSREAIAAAGVAVPLFETKARYAWVRQMTAGVITRTAKPQSTPSDAIDRWLTHRWAGLAFFVLLMFLIFQSITWVASIPQDAIDFAQQRLGQGIESILPPGPLRSLLVDGVLAGIGSVVVFLPQIAILFLFIAILEDCGYMSRAAFVMDKFMSWVGLSGKSFLPLMSSFACAIPGIMATRTIDNRKDRMVTLLIAPLMSCSARLPVYVLLLAFVPEQWLAGGWISLKGLVLFFMQSFGALVAIPIAWLLKRFLFRGEPSTFIMELSSYKWPSWHVVFARVWERVQSFLVRAGTLIFVTSVLVWAAAYFPGDHSNLDRTTTELELLQSSPEPDPEQIAALTEQINQEKSRLIETSWLGRAGHAIEPIVRPLGWNGQIGVAVLASFPAREVIVSTLGTIYAMGSDEENADEGLQARMRSATWPDGRPVFTFATALSIMVFFALCAQCASTLMVMRRETNSWRWPIFSFVYMTTLAYVAAWLTYTIASRW